MEQIRIGWARREISTDRPYAIPGQMYLRLSEGILDPLYATALAVDGGEGEGKVIFCTLDIVSIKEPYLKGILRRAAEKCPEIDPDWIVLGATHTHTGGPVIPAPEKSPDGVPIPTYEEYRDFAIEQASDAIVEAWKNRAPGSFAYGYGYAVVGHSRRTVFFEDMGKRSASPASPNGHGVMYGNTADPAFSHYEAGADHFLNAFYTFDEKGALTGIAVNVPCPSQVTEAYVKFSADYWNEVREGIAEAFGKDVFVLPQCAAAGDLSPRILHYKKAQARRFALKYGLTTEYTYPKIGNKNDAHDPAYLNNAMMTRRDIAERIVQAVKEVYAWASKERYTEATVRHVCETFPISRRLVSEEEKRLAEETLEKIASEEPKGETPEEIRLAASRRNSQMGRCKRVLRRWEEQKEASKLDTTIHVIRIGDVAFATNRFELYIDYMHRIQARSPFIQTFIIQLAGDAGSTYLPTERGKANKGYSATLFCNVFDPKGGQELVEETLRILNDMKNGDPEGSPEQKG